MPNTISDAVISVVITGRRMQVSEMFMDQVPAALRVCAALTRGAVGQQQLAVGDDGLAAVEAGLAITVIAVDRALDLDRLHLGDVVLDDEHEGAGLADLHRGRRHHHRLLVAQRQFGGDQRARPQHFVLVRHGGADRRHAGRRVDACSRSS